MPIFAESWESLVAFVVIMAISGIASWLKQRKGEPAPPWGDEEEGSGPPLRRTAPPPAPAEPEPVFDLERELRRMLGQEPASPPAPGVEPPTPTPPPVVVSPATGRTEPPPRPARRSPAPPPLPAQTDRDLDSLDAPTFELAPMRESAAARARAEAVDDLARARIEAARQRTEQAPGSVTQPHGRKSSPEMAALLASLRQPATARQAILATVVLGTPKALERNPG